MRWLPLILIAGCRVTHPGGVEDYHAAVRMRDRAEAEKLFERAWRPLLEEAEDEGDAVDELVLRSMAIRCLLEIGRIDSAEHHIRRGAALFRTVPLDQGDPVGLLLIRAQRAATVEDRIIEVSLAATRLAPGPALRYVHLNQVRLLIAQSELVHRDRARMLLEEAAQISRIYLDDEFREELRKIDRRRDQ